MRSPLHRAFFKALGDCRGGESRPYWQATVAGLVILRFADRRIAHATDLTLIDVDSPGRRRLTRQLEPEEARRAERLAKGLDRGMVVAAPPGSLVRAVLYRPLAEIAPALLVYAEVLGATAQWALAADVYSTVIRLANAPPIRDTEPFRALRADAIPQRRRARRLGAARRA